MKRLIPALLLISILGGAFGGKVSATIPCTCSGSNVMLTVGTSKYIYQPGVSTLYKNYLPIMGKWVLGTSTGTMACMVGVPPTCTSVGTGAIIRKIGTSF